ncbi:hypothetical protein [Alkalitalea saponilacus]|uniref:DUF4142 domain-containing protein n=1 Tax=Alkalitalea saponilacus TaxID=889453 RepID=A0A1T5BA53_9BACT|nr:hypothetical protein [Alkalitalea saponilacus]ASB49741.1 hypothetical protein CDL62_11630 [Alkalitalea saponilacus]SKB43909.1 hypothetical protein SAMN03080601_00456 [Alkalitalea saponilacus]
MKNVIFKLRKEILLVLVALFLLPVTMMAGTSSSENNPTDRRIQNIKQQHERYQSRLEMADSLITTGDTIRERTSIEIRLATDRMHERARAYTQERRELEKLMRNASREELTELRLQLRDFDQAYRQELNAYDEFMREVIRESEIGTRDFERGREIKREAERGLREATRLLAELQQEIRGGESTEVDVATN